MHVHQVHVTTPHHDRASHARVRPYLWACVQYSTSKTRRQLVIHRLGYPAHDEQTSLLVSGSVHVYVHRPTRLLGAPLDAPVVFVCEQSRIALRAVA